VVLGTLATSADGVGEFSFTVPESMAPTIHAITVEDPLTGQNYGTELFAVSNPSCTTTPGPGDIDGDTLADYCDFSLVDGPIADFDGDGVPNETDNCPSVANPTQADSTNSGAGNACDPNFGGSRVAGYLFAGSSYTSLVPGRLLESRPGATTVDGQSEGIGVRPAGSVTEVQVAGRHGVPGNASAAVLNVTVTGAQGDGFVTAWPCGTAMPNASSLNFVSAQTIPNAVISKIGAGGKVCLYTTAATFLLADINGFYPA
jgi:Thrombospondin type 3 repeat